MPLPLLALVSASAPELPPRHRADAHPRGRQVLCALGLAAALAGCSSQDARDLDGLTPGACSDVRPALSDVDEALRELGDEDRTAEEAAEAFKQAQTSVKEAQTSAEPDVAAALKELQTQLGFFRISVDSGGDDGAQAEKVGTALDDLVAACR